MTRRTGSMMAIGAAIVLIGAGIAHAKSHGDESGHGHGAKGHGGPHGGSGKHGGGGSDDGTVPGSSDDDSGKPGHGSGKKGPGSGKNGGHGGACDAAASSAIGAFVDATCPCDGVDDGNGGTTPWKNHGQYVRCVAHAVKDAARAAGVKRRCARDVVPCAAQSSCGKRNAVTCIVAMTGTCTSGACDDATPCATDADCSTSACGVTTLARCAEAGGTAGSGSCCSASPSGAFLD